MISVIARSTIALFSVFAASLFAPVPVVAQTAQPSDVQSPVAEPPAVQAPAAEPPTLQTQAGQPPVVQSPQAVQPAPIKQVKQPAQVRPLTQATQTPQVPQAQVPQATQIKPITPIKRDAAWWTDAGRILAGEVPNAASVLGKIANQPSVQRHRGAFARSWSQFEAARLKPAMKFAQDEITRQPQATGPIYYPFSGPDAMYALGMFPNATAFALAGLEPVGELPDLSTLSEVDLDASLAEVRRSLRSINTYSFFRTNDMRAEFSKNQFSGVTPILLLFITRQGFAVQNVEQIIMEPDATLRVTDAAGLLKLPAERIPGVRIRFIKPGETRVRTLHYFKADLSDPGLATVPQPLKWAAEFAPRATYLKSASYLMHTANFSQVRNFILARTELIVQDDSGIPVRFFSAANWDRAFFGTYDGPIRLFANRYQKDLFEAYATSAKPLEFGIGYDYQAKASNIQRFVRKRLALDDKLTGTGIKVAGPEYAATTRSPQSAAHREVNR